jgi:hypothetical protein
VLGATVRVWGSPAPAVAALANSFLQTTLEPALRVALLLAVLPLPPLALNPSNSSSGLGVPHGSGAAAPSRGERAIGLAAKIVVRLQNVEKSCEVFFAGRGRCERGSLIRRRRDQFESRANSRNQSAHVAGQLHGRSAEGCIFFWKVWTRPSAIG